MLVSMPRITSRVAALRTPDPPLPSEELPKPDTAKRGSNMPSA